MTDRFIGTWQVMEYVHDSAGRYLGAVRQTRHLHEQSDGLVKVVQVCTPEPSLEGHWMARFAGEWEFVLRRDGAVRHYLGPDVVGFARQWQDGCLTGRGIWPRFGCNFTSFSAALSPQRQLTGGTFTRAGEVVAVITGVGQLDDGRGAFPVLAGMDQSVLGVVAQPDHPAVLTRHYGRRVDSVGVAGVTPFDEMTIPDEASGQTLRVLRRYLPEGEQVSFDLIQENPVL